MIITKEQAQLLADLAGQIQDQYGLIVGYSNPSMPSPPMRDADFIIFESPEHEDLHCFHKDDIQTRPLGPYMVRVLPSEPDHDDKVEGLIARINNDLLDGKIWFDPGVSREVDDLKISVTKKVVPGTTEEIFETNILTDRYGVIYTYEFIAEAATHDKRFRIAKDIIDDVWPRQKKASKPKNPSKVQQFLSRVFRLFGF